MRQKDIRTRVAEVEAEAKGLEGVETEEEELGSSNKKLQVNGSNNDGYRSLCWFCSATRT